MLDPAGLRGQRLDQMRMRMGDAFSKAGNKPKAIGAYLLAAEGFAKQGFLPRAIAASKLVMELDPKHSSVQQMLADLYARKGGGPPVPKSPAPAPVAPPASAPEPTVHRTVSAPVTPSTSSVRWMSCRRHRR